ncbi:MAG: hypothetical protein FWF05_06430 [Oscillospiraceae bacterium]|nr:hypothetical protein [Oscillospiraceae bacterium]
MPEQTKQRKELSPREIFLNGVILTNPLLVQVVGLCVAVTASSTLKAALLLSAVLSASLLLCEAAASALLKSAVQFIRVATYMAIGLSVACPVIFFLSGRGSPLLVNTGIYLPLLAANSLVALRCEKFAIKADVPRSLLDALANALGASIVLISSGLARELLGAGTLYGREIFGEAPLPAMQMPFGGFLVLGFSAVTLKLFISIFMPDHSAEMPFRIKKTNRSQMKKDKDNDRDQELRGKGQEADNLSAREPAAAKPVQERPVPVPSTPEQPKPALPVQKEPVHEPVPKKPKKKKEISDAQSGKNRPKQFVSEFYGTMSEDDLFEMPDITFEQKDPDEAFAQLLAELTEKND